MTASHRSRFAIPFSFLLLCSLTASAQVSPAKYSDASLPIPQRVDDLVSRMTLAEKVSQMQNHAVAIPRLGVPAYDWWSEGLHGIARSGYATAFPQAIGLAATWDTDLQHRVASVIGIEARAKYNEAIRHDNHNIFFGLTLWSPNINIFRDPRWGRGQETYGEDPFLTGRMGVAFATGLRGGDPTHPITIATPKHFAVHSGPESSRHRFNVTPSPYDLEDTYLPAFRATITEARAGSLMCAYNAIDGSPACANADLLKTHLREAWHFQGFVTSDCGAIDDFYSKIGHHFSPDAEHASALAVRAGTDTTCGTEYPTLVQAVHDNLITEAEIDTSVKRLFTARFKLGMFDPADPRAKVPFSEVDSQQHRALALKAAEESIVLLKNQDTFLPFKPGIHTVAVIGPNAASLSALRGNYNPQISAPILPVDGFGSGVKVIYAQGAPYAAGLNLPAPRTLFHPSATSQEQGLKAEYFNGDAPASAPVLTRTDPQIDFDWNATTAPVPSVDGKAFAVKWTGTITPPAPGNYTFEVELAHCDVCDDAESFHVYIDDKQLATGSVGGGKYRKASTAPFHIQFADTTPHAFRLEYTHKSPLFGAGITLNWAPPTAPLLAEAVADANQADAVIAFVGLSPEVEGEEMPIKTEGFSGGDRTDIKLPAAQQQLLEAVAATGKPIVVVLMNGSALAATWAEQHAAAILEAWYPGEQGGTAIANTLTGQNNPAGRLPVTFYASIDQLPAFDDYAMKARTYRYFHGKPLYPFGFGLSYSAFRYANLKLSSSTLQAGQPLTVTAEVENTSTVPGDEVAELYLTPPASEVAPIRALQGFQRIHLKPAEHRIISFTLDPRQLSIVAPDGTRAVNPGGYTLFVGSAQPDENTPPAHFTINGKQDLPR